jgi:hypothetical protein
MQNSKSTLTQSTPVVLNATVNNLTPKYFYIQYRCLTIHAEKQHYFLGLFHVEFWFILIGTAVKDDNLLLRGRGCDIFFC